MSVQSVIFKSRLRDTFGDEFIKATEKDWGEPYELSSKDIAIPFMIDGLDFRLVDKVTQRDPNYYFYTLDLLVDGQPRISEEIAIPYDDHSSQEDRVLLFHSLVSTIVTDYKVELQEIAWTDQLRESRNREVTGPDPSLLLPNTLLTLADWECQLILAGIQAGLTASKAISRAKEVVYLQTTREGGEPGDLFLMEKCKSSFDQ